MPTIKEMATITVTRETTDKWNQAVREAADLLRALGDQIVLAMNAIADTIRALSPLVDEAERRQREPRSYPGSSATFPRRGRTRGERKGSSS